MKRFDPVHKENGKWYYWIETWADKNGPFETEEIAKRELKRYCEYLDYGEDPKNRCTCIDEIEGNQCSHCQEMKYKL